MGKQDRRTFLQTSAGVIGLGLPSAEAFAGAAGFDSLPGLTTRNAAVNSGKKPLRLGLIIEVDKDPDVTMRKLKDLELASAQLYVNDLDPKNAPGLRRSLETIRHSRTHDRSKRCL